MFKALLHATHQSNISIPDVADLLIERSENSSWVVAFKALITIHHLMAYGNEVNILLSKIKISCSFIEIFVAF